MTGCSSSSCLATASARLQYAICNSFCMCGESDLEAEKSRLSSVINKSSQKRREAWAMGEYRILVGYF